MRVSVCVSVCVCLQVSPIIEAFKQQDVVGKQLCQAAFRAQAEANLGHEDVNEGVHVLLVGAVVFEHVQQQEIGHSASQDHIRMQTVLKSGEGREGVYSVCACVSGQFTCLQCVCVGVMAGLSPVSPVQAARPTARSRQSAL